MSTRDLQRPVPSSATRRRSSRWLLVAGALTLVVAIILLTRLVGSGAAAPAPTVRTGVSLLALAVPAFLAGLLSFLSPCTLPILPTYFAYTFQTGRERVIQTTVAFFLGLATTMVVLGASASALSQLLFQNLEALTLAGGLVIIGFGVMSLLGKGFSGARLRRRPSASIAGSYVYGATFALGWTACVGPILGALLTMLATQGGAVLEGAVLAFIYALGLGTPLIATARYLSRQGTDSTLWRIMRGRGWTVQLGRRTLYLHSTSIASGLLLIMTGLLLATGQLAVFSRWGVQTALSQRLLALEDVVQRVFVGP